jgi:NAD(P)-dependent dehydrogenase (short-subunit alcohol dehydrogenase family)
MRSTRQKAAIEAFARSWAIELKDRRIRVNVIGPGPTATPIIEKLGVAAADLEAFERANADAIPLGRFARADEVAHAAVFLASDDGNFITGVNLDVDGGTAVQWSYAHAGTANSWSSLQRSAFATSVTRRPW